MVKPRSIRRHGLAAVIVGTMATAASAQAPAPITPPAQEPRAGTIIGGQSPAPSFERCVDVQIGNEGAFGCLNQHLRREVDKVNPSINQPPIDARSSDVRVGNVNEAAVRQQYGANYGRSAVPYRPSISPYVLPRR